MTYTITIPEWRPTPLNKLLRMHWAKRARTIREEALVVRCYAVEVPPARGKRRVRMTLHYPRGKTRMDPDAGWKAVLDGLVGGRQLLDDGPEWVELASLLYQVGPKATTIQLEDVEFAGNLLVEGSSWERLR